jgi:hypothetical protein
MSFFPQVLPHNPTRTSPPSVTAKSPHPKIHSCLFRHLNNKNHAAPLYAVSRSKSFQITLRPKYISQFPIFRYPQYDTPSFVPYKNSGKTLILHILTFVNCWTANWKARRTAKTESKYNVTIVAGIYLYIWRDCTALLIFINKAWLLYDLMSYTLVRIANNISFPL